MGSPWGCTAQRRAACPRLTPSRSEHVHNNLLRAVSLMLPPATGEHVLQSANCATQPPFPPPAPSSPIATHTESQLEIQRYSRQDSMLGNDAVGLAPFVHQPGAALNPHPVALLGQQPENLHPSLPRLHYCSRERREVAPTQSCHGGRQMAWVRCHNVEHHLVPVLRRQKRQDTASTRCCMLCCPRLLPKQASPSRGESSSWLQLPDKRRRRKGRH